MKKNELKPAIEALLIVSENYLAIADIVKLLKVKELDVKSAIEQLEQDYKTGEHGFEIRSNKDGYKFFTKAKYSELVKGYLGINNDVNLSPQAIETLAVVAYKQPISRLEVQDIRGVNSDGVIKTLEMHGLVYKSFDSIETGAGMYEVTDYCYELLGLTSKDDLVPLSPFVAESLEELGIVDEFVDSRKSTTKPKKAGNSTSADPGTELEKDSGTDK
jgi:segregation and condensation protein B